MLEEFATRAIADSPLMATIALMIVFIQRRTHARLAAVEAQLSHMELCVMAVCLHLGVKMVDGPHVETKTPARGAPLVRNNTFLLVAVGALALLSSGCDLSTTRSTSSSTGILSGTIDGKPVELHFVGDTEGKAVQTVDASAIAAAAGKAAGEAALAAVKAAVPGADQLAAAVKSMIPAPATDDTAKVVAGAGVASTLLASIIAAMKSQEAARHRRGEDEAWDRLAPSAPKGGES